MIDGSARQSVRPKANLEEKHGRTSMTRVDLTLPHHSALDLITHTQPRRRTTLDDRTPSQIQRESDSTGTHTAIRNVVHDHFRRGTR
jgi:hypothetical protein